MFKTIIATTLMLGSLSAFGWGSKGHQIVSYVGASLATDGQVFWGANLQAMRQLSTVPDRLWKASNLKAREGYQHFFQVDAYFTQEQFADIILFPNSYANAAKLHELTGQLVELEGEADDIHAAGLKRAFQEIARTSSLDFAVAREVFKNLERVTDAFEDVANQIDGIVIDHA